MVTRDLSKVQEALNALTQVEADINELEYLRKHLYSPNHSKSLCKSTISLITSLNENHANLVNALLLYAQTYASDDASLAAGNNPDYQYQNNTSSFSYTHAPEHKKSFWEKTVNQVVLGDFSDDVTWLGTTANVLLAFTGIDFILDARDTCGSIAKKDVFGTVMNGITFLPVIGVVGEIGKVAKHGDDIIDAGSTIIRHGDEFVEGGTTTIKSASKTYDGIKRVDEIEIEFKYNSRYDKTEFARQLENQQNGMNKLSVQEYMDNRKKYIQQGRSIESNSAQQIARENAYMDKVAELRRSGLSVDDAEAQAKKWIDSQAALHDPDQIAGGYANRIGGMGDRNINSSIGVQWKNRINTVDSRIKEISGNMTELERKSTYMNIKLTYK